MRIVTFHDEARQMFPNIIQVKRKRFAFRSGIERYKAGLAGIPAPASVDLGVERDVLVPIKDFAMEMGVCVRTIERWSDEARNASAVAA
jgi:hypothetical protein